MEFLDIHDGLMVSLRHIVAIEAIDAFKTRIHVNFEGAHQSFEKDLPYPTLKDILLSRNKHDSRQVEASIARNLEQLAKYQQNFAG
jgi:hypothetical protein